MIAKPQAPSAEPIVWIDCEMTGLDIVGDALVEIAVIVTDSRLRPLGAGIEIVIKPPPGATDDMDPVVVEMHTSSGLLDELDSGTTIADAEARVLDYIKAFVDKPGTAPLAGNSVGTDKMFLERDMPALTGFLHYRIIDVSSVKELARRWHPRAYFNSPKKAGDHRALADIAESIDELRYYQAVLFPAEGEPASVLAQAATKRIAATSTVAAMAAFETAAPAAPAAATGTETVNPDTSAQAPQTASPSGTGEAFGL